MYSEHLHGKNFSTANVPTSTLGHGLRISAALLQRSIWRYLQILQIHVLKGVQQIFRILKVKLIWLSIAKQCYWQLQRLLADFISFYNS